MNRFASLLFLTFALLLISCSQHHKPESPTALPTGISRALKMDSIGEHWIRHMDELHDTFPKQEYWYWAAGHPEEIDQHFFDYITQLPRRPDEERNILYVVKLGEMEPAQQRVFDTTKVYLKAAFGLPVKELSPIPMSEVPQEKRREGWDEDQIFAPFVLYELLLPRLPEDGFALASFTRWDLYPREDWGFVFGLAHAKSGTGIWSMNRYGDPSTNDSTFNSALKRTLGTAGHETGHVFGISHCKRYNCQMAGSNGLFESDLHPSWFCPQCELKLCANLKRDPLDYYQSMQSFWERQPGFDTVATHYRECIELLETAPAFPPR